MCNEENDPHEWLSQETSFHSPDQWLEEVNYMMGMKEKADIKILPLSTFLEHVFKQFIMGRCCPYSTIHGVFTRRKWLDLGRMVLSHGQLLPTRIVPRV
jgi:hypothetical protein